MILNNKVLRKIAIDLTPKQISRIINMEKNYIEKHLMVIKSRVRYFFNFKIDLYFKSRENLEPDTFLNTTKSFYKVNNTNFDDTVLLENNLDNVWSDKEEYYRNEILDRDKEILEYKISLNDLEEEYRKVMEKKMILKKELEELKKSIRKRLDQNIYQRTGGKKLTVSLKK